MSVSDTSGFVSVKLGDQWFGVPVLRVQDVITQTIINNVPLAPPEVAGSLNLRGRIVTAIDLRRRMGMAPREPEQSFMCVIVDRAGELYALLVDDVGDVLWLSDDTFEAPPVTLANGWRAVIDGLHRLEDALLLILNIEQTLTFNAAAAA